MSDVRYELRKYGFPQCAVEALKVVEQILRAQQLSINAPSLQLVNDIISEFIFSERLASSSKGKKIITRSLKSLEELELLEILCSYFSYGSSESTRNIIFLYLFPSAEPSRATILVKLVSLIVATRSPAVLCNLGKWLKQANLTFDVGLELAKAIVNDYLILVPEAKQNLLDLPDKAPEFTSCFLCGVIQLYGDRKNLPPLALLEVVTACAKGPMYLSTTSFNFNQVPMAPFLGLARWSIMAPVYGAPETEQYLQLHLELMESIVNNPKEKLISAEQLGAFIPEILNSVGESTHDGLNQTLIRFTQIVVTLFRMGMISGNTMNLFQQMDKLPKHELLEKFKTFRHILVTAPFCRRP